MRVANDVLATFPGHAVKRGLPHQCHRATSAGSGMMLTVKLRLAAVFDAQHGGFATGWSPVSWGSIDELFVNLTMPVRRPRGRVSEPSAWSRSSFTVLPDRTVGREHWPNSRSVQVHSAATRGFPPSGPCCVPSRSESRSSKSPCPVPEESETVGRPSRTLTSFVEEYDGAAHRRSSPRGGEVSIITTG